VAAVVEVGAGAVVVVGGAVGGAVVDVGGGAVVGVVVVEVVELVGCAAQIE
jgi:hypothetical protein